MNATNAVNATNGRNRSHSGESLAWAPPLALRRGSGAGRTEWSTKGRLQTCSGPCVRTSVGGCS